MSQSTVDKLSAAYAAEKDAVFSLFTLSGHVVSGRIMAIESTVTLAAGKETAEVPLERVEAFSYRKQ